MRAALFGLVGWVFVTPVSSLGGSARALPPIPDVVRHAAYGVEIDGVEAFVGAERSNGRIVATCFLEATGPAQLVITLPGPAGDTRISPRHLWETGENADRVVRSGNHIRVSLAGADKLLVRTPGFEPLLIVAMPREEDPPTAGDPDVIFFGPGVHDVGRLRVRSGQTVYLAPGSRVYGTIEGYEVDGVRVCGRGMLDGSRHTSHPQRIFGLVFDRSRNIRVEGIRIRECLWWVCEFLLCENVRIENLHLYSFYPINSGLMFDGCREVVARDCTILTYDDCICPHALNAAGNGEVVSENMLFEDCLLFNLKTGSGNAIRVGASFETSEVRNWTFRDITVAERNNAALISDHSDWAAVRNLVLENFHDETGEGYAVDMRIEKTRYSCTTGYRDDRGSYDGVYFINVQTAGGRWRLHGFDGDHRVANVHLYRCTSQGKPITDAGMLETNEWVDPVRICSKRADCEPGHLPPVVKTPGRALTELVIDNGDEGYAAYGFERLTQVPGAMRGDIDTADVPDGFSNFRAAVYEPRLQGRYRIEVHWGDHDRKATNAQWVVFHEAGYTTRHLSQSRTPGWHELGEFELNGDSHVRLTLPGYFVRANWPVVADAVRFTRAPE